MDATCRQGAVERAWASFARVALLALLSLLTMGGLVGCHVDEAAVAWDEMAPLDGAGEVAEQEGSARVLPEGAAGAGADGMTPRAQQAMIAPGPPLRAVVQVADRLRLTFAEPVVVIDAPPEAFVIEAGDDAVDIASVEVKADDPFVLELVLAPDALEAQDAPVVPDAPDVPNVPDVPDVPDEQRPAAPGIAPALSYLGGVIEVGDETLQPFDRVAVAPGKQLFLLLGQSNMAGRGALEQAPSVALDHVGLLAEDDGWVPADHPLNRYSTVGKDISIQKVGPGYAFAELVQRELGVDVGLIVNAKGGPGIGAWQLGADQGLLEAAIERAILAERSGVLRGVLWHHGEANRNQAGSYTAQMDAMLQALRAALGAPELYFVAGQLGTWRADNDAINAAIASVPDVIEHAGYVSGEGLERDGEGSHFSAAAQAVLGRRYAARVLRDIYGIEVTPEP